MKIIVKKPVSEKKVGVTELPRSLNPSKAIAMAIIIIIIIIISIGNHTVSSSIWN